MTRPVNPRTDFSAQLVAPKSDEGGRRHDAKGQGKLESFVDEALSKTVRRPNFLKIGLDVRTYPTSSLNGSQWTINMSAMRFNHGNHCIKHFLFKYYALISIVAFIIAVFLLGLEKVDGKAFLAIAGGILTFAYSVQKQHLEEMILFKDLFEKFNKRYDRLNEKLNHIYPDQQPPEKPFTDDETDALSNYFNLCGEEYLYFARGFIHPEVWRSWENGMKHFRENPRIKKLWEDELNQSSYYGLSFDKDQNNANTCIR